MAWLNRLFYDKNKKITFSNTEDQACEKQSCEGKLPRLDIGKNVGRVTMSRNPFLDLKEIELRDLSKHQIDALEQWCRRLIDDIFKQNYGGFYIDAEVNPGQPLIKSSIKRTIEERRKQDPTRFPRWIDGIVMEDLEYFICRDDLYSKYFRKIFEPFYSGKEEIRFVLQRLTAVRNRIAHGNAISVHEAEQALCYSNDIVGCCKKYYVSIGKDREYNVPVFTRIKDSLGTDYPRFRLEYYPWEEYFYGGPRYDGGIGDRPRPVFHSGENYKIWVEVDGSFHENTYVVSYTTTDIVKKFETTIEHFMKEIFKEIFLNSKYKYKDIKLYLVTSAYGKALGQENFQKFVELLRKTNQKDTLTNDLSLSSKLFKFQKRILKIEREIPPNPVIRRIT